MTAIALVCMVLWLISYRISDRFLWSQPISWIPSPILLAPMWLTVGLRLGMRSRHCTRRRQYLPSLANASKLGRLTLSVLIVCTILATTEVVIVELNGFELVAPDPIPSRSDTDGPEPQPIRLLFWNQAGSKAGDITPSILIRQPDLFLLANRHSKTSTHQLAQGFIDIGPAHAAVSWPFDLFSRYPIERWATTSLNLPGQSRRADGSLHNDPGNAAWYQLRLPTGKLLTLWAIDLPSSPKAPRRQLVHQAAASIMRWNGSIHQLDGSHTNTYRIILPSRDMQPGFPPPDLIVGDFNIPRHSHSLDTFLDAINAPAMSNAFDQAGCGWQKTWPRKMPLWAIDQCLVGRGLITTTYTTVDLHKGTHRSIQVDFVFDPDREPSQSAQEHYNSPVGGE